MTHSLSSASFTVVSQSFSNHNVIIKIQLPPKSGKKIQKLGYRYCVNSFTRVVVHSVDRSLVEYFDFIYA